jgi:ABC-type phosphate transport system substrate-binding protein
VLRTPATLLLLALLAAACGREPPAPAPAAPLPTLRLAVSSDAGLLVERWDRSLVDPSALAVETEVTTDSLAYAALLEGRVHAALVHRRASAAEEKRERGNDLVLGEGFTYLEIGETPISLLVHASNPVEVITLDQASGLLSGRLGAWAEVGGAGLHVERFVREADTATWQVIDEWLGREEPAPGQTLPDARAVATAVAASPAALGTGGGAPHAGARPLGLRLPGGELIMPLSTAGSGAVWPLQRPLLVVTRGARRSLLDGWLKRVTGAEGRALAEQNGYVLSGLTP